MSSEPGELNVTVNKATFFEVGRIFQRVYRPSGSANVILTLGNGRLLLEFYGGGSELKCDTPASLQAEMTAKAFARIVTAYRWEKDLSGTMTLTFRPELGEFATPKAGAKAKFF